MKHHFLFALLFCAAASPAQTPFSILKDLEGSWYESGRGEPVYSEWHFTDDQTIVNRVFTLLCGDTTELSHATLHFEGATATLLLHIDSLGAGSQVYQLVTANADEIIFKSENPAVTPRQLAWQFFRHSYLTTLVDMDEYVFYRKQEPALKASLNLRLGANSGMYHNSLSPDGYGSHYEQRGLSTELSLGLALRGKGPLGYNFELGLRQKKFALTSQYITATQNLRGSGIFRNTDFYASFMPELELGKTKDFILSAGIFSVFTSKNSFKGKIKITDENGGSEHWQPELELGDQIGLLFGLSWQLPKTTFPIGAPFVYCRGMWGLGNAGERAVSVGVGFRLK